MTILTHQCPHCHTAHIGLQIIHATRDPNRDQDDDCWLVNVMCPRCKHPSGALLSGINKTRQWADVVNSGLDASDFGWEIEEFWPATPKPLIPENLPPDVERIYLQAERNFPIEGNEEASGTMFRKALDIGLRKIDSKLNGTLAARIRKLAADGKLTADIAEWSDGIREIGNDAAHEEAPVTRQELEALRNFSDAVLRYLFTLPEMVKQRRQINKLLK